MAKWNLYCFICVFLVTFFDETFALLGNSPPVIQASSNKYVIIGQSLPQRSVLLNVQASDPENGTLFYSIIGVTYYRNGTAQPVKAFNLQWAVKTVPIVSFDACKAAESYSFPRNLFCMDPNNNTIKTTAKYDQLPKADFSLFALTVLVTDNGIPQSNVTTKVYFRVKENCTAGATEYTNLVQNCPQSLEIIKRGISSPGELSYQFIVPNNTKITRITIDFSKFAPFKFIEEVIKYEFRYEKQTKLLLRRLLVDTTREPKLEIYLWNPVDVVGTTANITLTLSILSEKGRSPFGGSTGIELYLLDRSKHYCADSNCVSLYSVMTSVLTADGRPECARKDGFTTIAKYGSCKVIKGNSPPFIQVLSNKYVVIDQSLPQRSVLLNVQASDPENGTLFYSIIGVTYYRNGTAQPVKAFNLQWAVKTVPIVSFDACKAAESYSFPRNLFCMDPNNNTIKTTAKYDQFKKADFSLFALTVLVMDNGIPQSNVTTKVYFRVKENCTAGATEYTNLVQKCPQSREIFKRGISFPGELSFQFIVPNNTKITRMTIDFSKLAPFKFIEEVIKYEFRYEKQTKLLLRRLLVNTTREPKLKMYLWNPIDIVGTTANITLTLRIISEKGMLLLGGSTGIELYLLDRSKNYCADSNCVSLYSVIISVSNAGGSPECARNDGFTTIAKYGSCKVNKAINTAPTWVNSKSNYVTVKRDISPGTTVFKIVATDSVNQNLTYSLTSATYYQNETSQPAKLPLSSWPITATGNILTSGMFASLRPGYKSVFILNIMIADNGTPILNTTGRVFVRILNDCPVIHDASKQCMPLRQNFTSSSSVIAVDSFSFNAFNFIVHKMMIDFRGFMPFDSGIDFLTIQFSNATGVIVTFQRRILQHKTREPQWLLDIDPSVKISGSFSVSIEFGKTKLRTLQVIPKSVTPITIFGLPRRDFCKDEICRAFYNRTRINLRKTGQLECLRKDISYLLDGMFQKCGIVFSSVKLSVFHIDWASGRRIQKITAFANDPVIFSIMNVTVWFDGIPKASTASNATWRLKSMADVANDCEVAVTYTYPRNLFCIDSSGLIKTTSKFQNTLKVFSLVAFDVVATDSTDPKKFSTMRVFSTSEPNITHFHCAEIRGILSSFKRSCDNTKGSPIVLSRIAQTSEFQFTAPSVRSLVTQIGVKLNVLGNAKLANTITYTFVKPNAIVKSIMIPGKSMRFKSPVTFNSSLYRQPLELAPNERVTVKLSTDFTPDFQGNDTVLYTIPVKDYCLSDCVNRYINIVNSVPVWYPNFPCGYSNQEFYNAKYGYCLGNSPPKIVSPNTFTPDAASAKPGSLIGHIVATDPEKTKLVYGFEWIHSFLTTRNVTVKLLSSQPCVDGGKVLAPFNYICINRDTGAINITSQYVKQMQDVLTVRVYAVDSGKPRRIASQTITISFKDQCEKAVKSYLHLVKNCMNAALSPINSLATKSFGKRLELNIPTRSPPDRVVLLVLDLKYQLFPKGTLHTIFTLEALTSVEPVYVYGEKVQVMFNNSAHNIMQSTIVMLPVRLSVAKVWRVVVSAISFANTTTTTTTTATTAKAPTTTTTKRTPTTASTTTSKANSSIVLTLPGPTTKSQTTKLLTNATTTAKSTLYSTTRASNQTTAPPTLATTTTSKRNSSITTTAGSLTLPPPILPTTDPNSTTAPPKPLRKRRFLPKELVKQASVSLTYVTQNSSITVYGTGISLRVQKYKDFCGSTACVTTYKAWVSETTKVGVTKCGKDPFYAHNYFKVCLNPPIFKTEPINVEAKLNQRVRLTCSYQNFTQVKSFQWLKDGRAYVPPRLDFFEGRIPRAVTPDSTRYLDVQGSNPELQGYYTCMVKDALNNTVKSKESLVHFTDVSSTKMSVKIKRTFSNALKDKTSTEYKTLSQDVSKALNAKLDSLGMHKNRKIVINRFRAGSVIVDANVYFLSVNSSNRNSICSQLRNVSSASAPSNLEIESVETTSFDCCYASQTGEANVKGIISWRTTIANFADTQDCPYAWFSLNGTKSLSGSATRKCLPEFRNGAMWQYPEIEHCGYKSATTQILADIAKTNITDRNVQDISTKLDTATSSPKDFTNRFDVKFASDAIENLVKSKKKLSTIAKDILNATSNMMDVNITLIADSQLRYKSSSRILSSLNNLANEIPITNNTPVITVRRNVAFAVKLLNQTTEDIIIATTRQKRTGFNLIDISSDKAATPKRRREQSAEIRLSKAMVLKAESLKPGAVNRIYSFVFENDRLFITSSSLNLTIASGREWQNKTRVVDSRILSAAFGGLKLMNLTSAEEMKGRFRPVSQKPGRIDCVFWDTRSQGGYGAWSTEGCRYYGMQDGMHRCRCDHLTNFAILLDVTGKGTPKGAALALSIVTYIGCGISLLSLVIVFLTFIIFKKLRVKRPPRILICLCFALIATLVIFLAGISAKDLKSCQAIAILIHYFVLVSFMWMAVEGFNLYLSFVRIMNTDITHFILKSSGIAWGIPAVIVAITAGVTKLQAYGKKNGDEWICMVTGTAFYAGYLTPILVIVVANLIVMGFVIRSLKKSAQVSKDRKMTGLTMARIIAACSVLMGTTWVIGLFAVDVLTLPVQIAFCVLNSLQGFFIFLFYGVRNSDVRKQWKAMCGWRSSEDSRSGSAPDYSRKRQRNTDSVESNKRLMVHAGKDDYPMSNLGSGTLTTSVSGTLATDKSSATLTSFAAQPSTKKGYFPESETNGLQTSSENMEMSFQLQPGKAGKENGAKVAQPSFSTATNGSHVNRGLKGSGSDSMEMTFGIEPVEINIEIKIPE